MPESEFERNEHAQKGSDIQADTNAATDAAADAGADAVADAGETDVVAGAVAVGATSEAADGDVAVDAAPDAAAAPAASDAAATAAAADADAPADIAGATAAPATTATAAATDAVPEAETGLKKPITRRTVVAAAGGTIAGLVIGGFLGTWGVTSSSIAAGRVAILSTPTKLIVTNRSRCSGCQRCEMMCSLRNDGHVSQLTARVKVSRNYYFGKSVNGPDGTYHSMEWTVESCKQCQDPWCAKFCPVHAIVSDEKSGARVVDKEACIGCGMCHAACPWNMPTVDTAIGKSTKCIACGRCAEQCPNSAILFVDWEDIAAKVIESGEVSTAKLVAL